MKEAYYNIPLTSITQEIPRVLDALVEGTGDKKASHISYYIIMPHTEMQIPSSWKPEEHSLLSKRVWEVGEGTHNTHCKPHF